MKKLFLVVLFLAILVSTAVGEINVLGSTWETLTPEGVISYTLTCQFSPCVQDRGVLVFEGKIIGEWSRVGNQVFADDDPLPLVIISSDGLTAQDLNGNIYFRK